MSSIKKSTAAAAETHGDLSTGKRPSPKLIIQSFHKGLPLEKQPKEKKETHGMNQSKPRSTKPTATVADTHGDLSPSNHPTPKAIMQSIHKELLLRKRSAGKNETHSINDCKPMSSIAKPITTVTKTSSDLSTGKCPPPKPTIQSIHKDLPLRKQSNEKKVSHMHCINQSKPASKPTPTVTGTHSDLPTGKHPPPKLMLSSVHKDLLLKKRYASVDVTTRDAVGKYQKLTNIQPPLPPKPVAYSNNSAASHQAVDKHPKPPPLPPKHPKPPPLPPKHVK